MTDRLFFSALGLAAFVMIALALVWPQGLGAPSPWPFGHPIKRPEAAARQGPPPSILPGLSAATGEQAAKDALQGAATETAPAPSDQPAVSQ